MANSFAEIQMKGDDEGCSASAACFVRSVAYAARAQQSADNGIHDQRIAKRQKSLSVWQGLGGHTPLAAARPQASHDDFKKISEACYALAGIKTVLTPQLPCVRVAKIKVPLRVGRGDSLEEARRIHTINLAYLKRRRHSAQARADGAQDAGIRRAIRNEKRRHAGHLKRRFPITQTVATIITPHVEQ